MRGSGGRQGRKGGVRGRVRRARLAAVPAVLCLLALGLGGAPAHAGGGASRTLVVVNEDSPTSLYLGNHYAALRHIPASQICRLKDIPHRQLTTIALYRERIVAPIEAFLTAHGLDGTIDTVAFSTDFPFAADYKEDGAAAMADDRVPSHIALNGALFLARRVLAKDAAYAALDANRYGRVGPGGPMDSQGFRSTYLFERSGEVKKDATAEALAASPDRYRLATLLGWHGLQGETVPEIAARLERSVAADGTKPKGTVYLMDHPDVRARTRQPFFEQTIEALDRRGRKGVVLKKDEAGEDGVLPRGHDDVVGVTAGIAGFDWGTSGSVMVPGALAEHLTSFGGRLDGSGQTKLIAFLQAGAAGASGTVCEPLSIWAKFPTPFLHVHYADGCSLAEAFYQSVMGPYQLLIVGDPLTRPFAHLREVKGPVVDPKTPWRGTVEIDLQVGAGDGVDPSLVEVYVDGRLTLQQPRGAPLVLDTTTWEDGGHDLAIAVITDDAIETRSEWAGRIEVVNGKGALTLVGPRKPVGLDEDIKLSGKAPSACKTVSIRHGYNVLLEVPVRGGRWKATLPAARLGRGTVVLHTHGTDGEGAGERSPFLEVVVEAAEPLGTKRRSRRKDKDDSGKAGLAVTVVSGKGKAENLVVTQFPLHGKERLAGQLGTALEGLKGPVTSITCEGAVVVPADGQYQWAVTGPGTIEIRLYDEVVLRRTLAGTDAAYAEVTLTAGAHPLSITLEPEGAPSLSILLGGDIVPQVLGGTLLRH